MCAHFFNEIDRLRSEFLVVIRCSIVVEIVPGQLANEPYIGSFTSTSACLITIKKHKQLHRVFYHGEKVFQKDQKKRASHLKKQSSVQKNRKGRRSNTKTAVVYFNTKFMKDLSVYVYGVCSVLQRNEAFEHQQPPVCASGQPERFRICSQRPGAKKGGCFCRPLSVMELQSIYVTREPYLCNSNQVLKIAFQF